MKKYLKSFLKTIFSFNFIREKFDKLASFYFENVCSEEIERIYHFEKYKLGKQGGIFIDFEFPEADAKALQKVVKMIAKENILIAEIGSWKGMSTVILAKSIAPYQGKVFAVDHWKGSEGVIHHEIAKKIDIFQIFRENISYFGVENLVYPLIMDSLTAASIFADEILDLVFIDADHRYEFVKKDILAWLPKIKKGGIICGHDSENYHSSFQNI
jgi:predicted O-methyltransferase YrrM